MKTRRSNKKYTRKTHTRKNRGYIGGSSPNGKVVLKDKKKPAGTRRMSFFGPPSSFNLSRSMVLQNSSVKPLEESEFPLRPVAKPQIARDGKIAVDVDPYVNNSSLAKRKAAEIISSAILNSAILTKGFLKKECIDSNVCMGFGKHRQKIIDYFEGFTKFKYVDDVPGGIIMLGSPSVNGFIIQIKYTRHKGYRDPGYTAYTILKSARDPKSDNLAYEYIVGKFINKQCSRFPCFLQTYGLYYYKDEESWSSFKDTPNRLNKYDLKKLTLQKDSPVDFPKMCEQSKYAAILIEHIKNANTLQNMILGKNILEIIKFNIHELIYILYQVYMPLAQLQDVFTHYDLHSENVQLYEPLYEPHVVKYIEYHYHLPREQIVTFKSRYIAKIIDYGRSYYSYGASSIRNPKNFFKQLCETNECNIENEKHPGTLKSACGEEMGLAWLYPDLHEDYYFISSSLSNPSHDLRLLYQIYGFISQLNLESIIYNKITDQGHKDTYLKRFKILNNMFGKVVYGQGITNPDDYKFGTEPNGKRGYPSKINNVKDAEESMRDIIMLKQFQKMNNEVYKDANKIGDMHIYSDGRPMEFNHA